MKTDRFRSPGFPRPSPAFPSLAKDSGIQGEILNTEATVAGPLPILTGFPDPIGRNYKYYLQILSARAADFYTE